MPSARIRFGQRRIVQRRYIAPACGEAAQAIGHRVDARIAHVAERLDGSRIVPGQQALEGIGDGIIAKIGRDIADPQASLGVAVIAVWPG